MYQKGSMAVELTPVTVSDTHVHVCSTRLRQVYTGCPSTHHGIGTNKNVEHRIICGSRRTVRCPALIESATLVSTEYVRDVAAVCGTVAASFGFVAGVKLLENRGYVHKVSFVYVLK